MRTRTLAFSLPLLLTLAGAAVPTAHGAEETCHGEPATIVGDPGLDHTLLGSDGNDVIVTNGAESVAAAGGDDLVCVTGEGPVPQVSGDDGDDVIDSTGVTQSVEVFGGDGADTITTGPGDDSVIDSVGGGPARSPDHITTGDGDDYIGTGGLRSSFNPDVIDSGDGDDQVLARGSGWTADGGAGRNTLTTAASRSAALADDWVVDVTSGVGSRDGQEAFRFSGFRRFDLQLGASEGGTLVFHGSESGETFVGPVHRYGRLVLDLRGGDDHAFVGFGSDVSVSAGTGTDRLNAHGDGGQLDADLAAGTWTVDSGQHTSTGTLTGFERTFFARFDDAVVRGTAGADVVTAAFTQCVTLRGRGGDDVLRANHWYAERCGARLLGSNGADRLVGRGTDDVLLGGSGVDLADGGAGRDRCTAETRENCETE